MSLTKPTGRPLLRFSSMRNRLSGFSSCVRHHSSAGGSGSCEDPSSAAASDSSQRNFEASAISASLIRGSRRTASSSMRIPRFKSCDAASECNGSVGEYIGWTPININSRAQRRVPPTPASVASCEPRRPRLAQDCSEIAWVRVEEIQFISTPHRFAHLTTHAHAEMRATPHGSAKVCCIALTAPPPLARAR